MNFLYLIVFFPLLGFLLLSFSQNKFSKNISSFIGVSSIGLSFLSTIFICYDFFSNNLKVFNKKLWIWIQHDKQIIDIGLTLDSLSLTMITVTTGVGLLINIFAIWYMRHENHGYARFFAYTNLFIANMVLMVLSDNMMLMYLGWEGVGICSYLLIGFYHEKTSNGISALKAFITTRVGDVFLIFAIFILFNELNTLNFIDIKALSSLHFQKNSIILQLITIFILLGAIGKSAQIPLHTWLSDAMVGPTPVSALIHAATMITAGVYLIARNYYLFLLTSSYILNTIAIVGVTTLLLAGIAALVQNDIKRILAYSTISQVGYMFLALGIKAWDAAIFHLMTHAFFKSLLFISAGSVIQKCQHEQNIFKIGNIKKEIPFIYFCFLVSGASIASFPIITSGFFSKEKILFYLLENNHFNFLIAGLIGTFITSLYIFRMIFVIFHGKEKIKMPSNKKSFFHTFPLIILLILSSSLGGLFNFPLKDVFNIIDTDHPSSINFLILSIIASFITFLGIFFAFLLWCRKEKTLLIQKIKIFIAKDYFVNICSFFSFSFNYFYEKIFVNNYISIAKYLQNDPLQNVVKLPINLVFIFNKIIIIASNGYIRWYITSIIFGAILILTLIIFT